MNRNRWRICPLTMQREEGREGTRRAGRKWKMKQKLDRSARRLQGVEGIDMMEDFTSSCSFISSKSSECQGEEQLEEDYHSVTMRAPCKFELYQKAVQSPKGDIRYLQKFFLQYIGGRVPLHLQEDFCGTAFLSAEWIRSDARRTAVGLDLDLEALLWCLKNNVSRISGDAYTRIFLFHGDVLQPLKAKLVRHEAGDVMDDICLLESSEELLNSKLIPLTLKTSMNEKCVENIAPLPKRDIVCALNYSCCCLLTRADLLIYFKNVLGILSRHGGIFVMDLYGGISSEGELKLKQKFSNFTYVWEQEKFDIITRMTRVSLHFQVGGLHMIHHAFTYHWRLWSLPEVKDCLLEAGFRSVHFWMREMPDTAENENAEEYKADQNVKYEEVSSFQQSDAWNAFVVSVAN